MGVANYPGVLKIAPCRLESEPSKMFLSPASPLGTGGLDVSSSSCPQTSGEGFTPPPCPLPGGPTSGGLTPFADEQSCTCGLQEWSNMGGRFRNRRSPMSRIHRKIHGTLALWASRNGQKRATFSETAVVLFPRQPQRLPRRPQEVPRRPKRPPRCSQDASPRSPRLSWHIRKIKDHTQLGPSSWV